MAKCLFAKSGQGWYNGGITFSNNSGGTQTKAKGGKMTITAFTPQAIEGLFSSLPQDERAAIISYGIAIRLSDLRKRLFLAESKVNHFEGKYRITLVELDSEGLPDDADWEMHEDYILWHHWAEVIEKTREVLVSLEDIASSGLCLGGMIHAGGS
jgi:hypothetical protein